MRIDRRLRADFSWVLCGNAIYSACQWGIVLVLAKMGSAAQVGEYALAMAIAAPIVLFANLQLRALLASDVKNEFTFAQYFTFRMVSLGTALLALAGVVFFMRANREQAAVVLLVGFSQVLEYLSEIFYAQMQKCERMDRLSTSYIIKGPLSLAFLCLGMYFTRSVFWAIAGLVAGRLVVLLSWDARRFSGRTGESSRPRFDWSSGTMLRILKSAFPLGVISMLIALNTSIPRYFVEAYAGTADLGVFSAIASLLTAGSLVVAAFGMAVFLPVAKACAASDRGKFRSYVLLTVVLGGTLGSSGILIAALFGREVLSILFRPEYGARADVFIRLMIGGTIAFMTSGAGYVMTAARSLKPQIPLLLITLAAGTAASAWAIPRYGILGAADASIVAALVNLAGTAVILARIDRRLSGANPGSRAGHPAETVAV